MSKKSDLTGKVFSKITVIEPYDYRISNTGRRQSQWLCLCECGEKTVVASNNLISGTTKSCGCDRKMPRRRIDLTGKRFGYVVVNNYHSTTKRGQAIWSCICDCGNSALLRATSLQRGKVKSCGCYRTFFKQMESGRAQIGATKWANIVKEGMNCLKCNSSENQHAHHIVPVSANKLLERSLFNGVTLCRDCHNFFHAKYGKETATIDNLWDFCSLDNLTLGIVDMLINNKGREDIEKAIHELQLILELRYK